jgi:PIF1-like helicase
LHSFDDVIGIPRIIAEETADDPVMLQELWADGYRSANIEQKSILDTIQSAIISGLGGLFFIDGPGGTGKTFVENLLLNWVRGNSEIALAVASSGIASILLHQGRTSHSRFHIPIDIQPESVCAVSAQSAVAELLRRTELIIWDEISSQHRYCFEAVDRTLKDLHKNDEWFGGIPVVFAGTSHSTIRLTSRRLSTMPSSYSKGFPGTNLSVIYRAFSILERCSDIQTHQEYETPGTVGTNDCSRPPQS